MTIRETAFIESALVFITAGWLFGAPSDPASCQATATSIGGPSRAHTTARLTPPASGLVLVQEIPLPGPAVRFDYQSYDPFTHRIYMNHMNAGTTLVFNTDSARITAEITGVPRATGVWAVPAHHQVYISAAGAHEVVIVDDRTLAIVARIGDIHFPDGIAYARNADKVFVSDESGNADVVIDPITRTKRATIALGGEAGNTHYDSVSGCILVAVQTRNELVAIDPATERVVQRYALPGSDEPHGFVIDEADRLAFITSEGNALLQVLSLETMRVVAHYRVGSGPDVLAWDPEWRRLYVASENGGMSAFWLDGTTLNRLGVVRAPHAHTVSVDPRTHRVYLPLENIGGRPVLRVYRP